MLQNPGTHQAASNLFSADSIGANIRKSQEQMQRKPISDALSYEGLAKRSKVVKPGQNMIVTDDASLQPYRSVEDIVEHHQEQVYVFENRVKDDDAQLGAASSERSQGNFSQAALSR